MTKFREHRGSLDDSMKTVVPMTTRQELIEYVKKLLSMWACLFRFDEIEVKYYVYDDRIGWDTYIVTMPDYGVLGFTDGPV